MARLLEIDDRRHLPEYHYKQRAIQEVGGLVRSALAQIAVERCTFVPIPPSKAKDDPLYDDRLVRALRQVPGIDVRELLHSTQSREPAKAAEVRPKPDDLYSIFALEESLLEPPVKKNILLFDDVLTTGAHFKACQRRLREALPDRRIIGIFVCRVKRPDLNPAEAFDGLL